ncbi:MAG: immunoglobulin domain-containing protein, partial [Chitinivibrionales bacterium]
MRALSVPLFVAVFAITTPHFFSCTTAPFNPYDISNAKITIFAQSSAGIVGSSGMEDSTGNIVKIGILCNLWNYVDSVQFRQVILGSTISKDSILGSKTGTSALKYTDTVWQSVIFNEMGTKTVEAIAYLNNGKILSDSIRISIYPKPIINHPPVWQKDTINEAGRPGNVIILTLADKCTDPDGDVLSFSLMSGPPDNDSIANAASNPAYTFTPGQGDTGVFYPRIVATDSKGGFDTLTIALTIHAPATIDSVPPIVRRLNPPTDSITVSSNSYKVSVICKDSSGIASVKCSSGTDTFSTGQADSVWSATITGLVQGQYKTVTFTAIDMSARASKTSLNVFIKFDSTMADNVPPLLRIASPSKDTIIAADSCLMQIICKDASGVGSVSWSMGASSISATKSPIADSVWTATIKGLSPGQYSKITVVATDASPATNKDSATIRIKYDNDKTPPAIRLLSPANSNDSAIIAVSAATVQVVCKDNSGIASVSCAMGGASFMVNKSPSADSIWSVNIIGLTAGQFRALSFVASDSSLAANKDTLVAYIKYDNDTLAPVITRSEPALDTISVNAGSYTVKVACRDPSGVSSVVFVLGTASFPAAKTSDSIWSATVSGLSAGVYGKILVIATDASLKANKDTMALFIKNDPTMADLTGPGFFQKTGPINNAVVVDSSVTIVDSIYDPSGVDSVYWTLNGVNKRQITGLNGRYTLIDTLRRYHLDTIMVYAVDNATAHNKSSQTIVLNYNVPPVINDTSVSTNRNVAKTWTLNALSVDGDPLTWTRITSPSALSGAVTGPLPSVTFTPAANWSGADSFSVRVTDGYWSDTAKVKITVVNVFVAPSIVTQPSGATKNVGQSVTFSVAINADVNPAPSYQWQHNGSAITTAIASSYTIGSIALSDSGSYTVTIANSAGTITSQPVTLTVNFAPSITKQPLSQTLYLNQPDTFAVVATGKPTPTYVWKKNGAAISGQTGASLILPSPGISDSGKYTVTVTNSVGTLTSDTARFYAGFKSVAAGGSHSLILKTDGRLFGCGSNNYGQLGNITTNGNYPVQIMTGVQCMSAGYRHSLILRTDGALFACGYNSNGQLGDGTTTDQHSFIQIMTGVKSIAAGTYHSLILKTDGTVFASGNNSSG